MVSRCFPFSATCCSPAKQLTLSWFSDLYQLFQTGLNWGTVLRKEAELRRAFCNFEPERVAAFDEADVARLLANEGIIRHQGKIRAVINNARCV